MKCAFLSSIILCSSLSLMTLLPSASGSVIATSDIGVQLDSLQWSITTPTFHPSVLSELTFKTISPTGRLNFGWFPENFPWWITAQYSFGKIVKGTVTDEDFALDDRNGIFSQSEHDSTDHNVQTGQFRLGYGWFGAKRLWISPHLGFQWQFSRFNISEGKRTIPDGNVDFSQLNSEYSAQWLALSLGAMMHYELSKIPLIFILDSTFFPFADYRGKGLWNLRSDFAQNPSFEHRATGMGGALEVQMQYRFAPRWRVGIGGRGQIFKAKDGTDKTYFSDGSKISIPLNEVVHKTLFFFFNASYQW